MLTRSTWLHLRIPFSYFLMPVYLFAVGVSPNLNESRLLWVFLIIHFLLYPASHGFNSYFDKDEKSIGGLRHPPPVRKGLFYMSLLLDGVAIFLGYILINPLFATGLLFYGLASKAYSHPWIRLKKYPIGGWLVTGFFQGFFTFVLCYTGINDFSLENVWQGKVLFPAILTSIMLWGNYPMTQVYQHEEDAAHGDLTLSRMLGIRGTFLFVMIVFSLAVAGFMAYFTYYHAPYFGWIFLITLSPVALYFFWWFYKVWQNPSAANFINTMRLNFISATCLNGFFVYFFFGVSHIGQYL